MKIFICCALLLMATYLNAQNLVGFHRDRVMFILMDEYKKHPNIGDDNDNGKFIWYTEDGADYMYNFDKNDTCNAFVITGKYESLSRRVAYFNKNYEKINDEEWMLYDKNFKFRYKLYRDEKDWSLIITRHPYQH